mgnify:FL=1
MIVVVETHFVELLLRLAYKVLVVIIIERIFILCMWLLILEAILWVEVLGLLIIVIELLGVLLVHLVGLLLHWLLLHLLVLWLWIEENIALGVQKNLWWVNLTNIIKRLLSIPENDFSCLFEAGYLDFNNFSDTFLIVLDISDALIIFDYARDA